eukprot:1138114-Pelagomonas_calceolata.AAC.2
MLSCAAGGIRNDPPHGEWMINMPGAISRDGMQVTDTPGVMSRGDDERNKMELLTLAALDCLPTSDAGKAYVSEDSCELEGPACHFALAMLSI